MTAIATAERPAAAPVTEIRSNWTRQEILDLFVLPFNDLLRRAHETHRRHFDPNTVQLSTLLNIKTGGCQEDCKYCAQSVHYDTGLGAGRLLDRDEIRAAAEQAKAAGAARFCMGAAWRELKDRDLPRIAAIIADVKALGLETCMTICTRFGFQPNPIKDEAAKCRKAWNVYFACPSAPTTPVATWRGS